MLEYDQLNQIKSLKEDDVNKLKLLFSLFALVALTGCVTTKTGSDVSTLQLKVSQLERSVEDRDQQISDLKYEVEDLKNQVQDKADSSAMVKPGAVAESVEDVVAPASGGDEIIRVGVSPQDVQKALKNAGYYSGAIDGKVGAKTKQAIADFQKEHNLKSDGIIGKKTWVELKKFLE